MPIKPENKNRYPADWKQIRERILARALDRCEKCRAPNLELIARGAGRDAGLYATMSGDVFSEVDGAPKGAARGSEFEVDRWVAIVLTVAHLDHTPENCADENLRAYCQKCHLAHDREHHLATAARTRRARRLELEPELPL